MGDQSATLQLILQGMGIPSGAFSDLIHQAIVGSWTSEQLVAEIYASDAFKAMFPGIFRDDGSLLMSPGEYRAAADQYTHLAYDFGYHIDRTVVGNLIAGQKSPQEFVDTLTAVSRIDESPQVYAQYLQVLKDNGIKNAGAKEVLDFALGEAPKEWNDLWEETQITAAAKMAGSGISHEEAQKLMERAPDRFTEASASAGFKDLALQHLKTQPLSKLYGMGLTKSELLQYEFGGPHQAAVTDKIGRILSADDAFFGQRATSQLVPTQAGGTTLLGAGQQARAQVA